MTTAAAPEPGYLSWGPASVKLMRTIRFETARSGHADILPAHVLLAALDQPEMHQALRAIKALPDVYAIRGRVAASSLGPLEYQESLPMSALSEALLGPVRPHRPGEPYELLYALVFKAVLSNQACRVLLARAGVEPGLLDRVFDRIE